MVKRKAYFIDADAVIRNDNSYVRLLLKGKKSTRMYFRYDPYFYVEAPAEKADEILNVLARDKKTGETAKPLRVETCEKNVFGKAKKLLKVFCKKPQHVPIVKAFLPYQCYEYNIPFFKRFMIDFQLAPFSLLVYERENRIIKNIISVSQGDPKLSRLAFDIETYNPKGAPREKVDPAVMISYANDSESGVLTYKTTNKNFVKTYADERTMLEGFIEVLRRLDPDILYGYNSANFDIPYLEARAASNKVKLAIGRGTSHLRKINRGMVDGLRIEGRTHVDLYPLVRFFGFIGVIKAQRFTLDAIAEEVLGKKKRQVNRMGIWEIWDNNEIGELSEYSLTDSKLTFELGEMLLPLQMELSSITKTTLFDVSLSSSGQLVESLLMYNSNVRNEIVPNRPSESAVRERTANPIQGAFVKLPEPGIYENIVVLDFRGLYPSIIISYNIDPFTLAEDNEQGVHLSPSGARFSKGQKGLIPSTLEFLVDLRGSLKHKLKGLDKGSQEYVKLSARSQALKILANSFYGYLGYARSRWYNRNCAESTTAWGRKHIQDTISEAEKSGFKVLYGDTDSTFLLMGERTKEDVLRFVEKINKSLPEKMELELEAFYTRGVFVSKKTLSKGVSKDEDVGAKKKYALLAEDGRIKIRGFELVRRDWSQVAKDTQLKVLEAILKEGSKEKAVKIVRDVVERLKSGKVPLEELAISTQLNKDPKKYEVTSPELSAGLKAIKRGVPLEQGSIISYVITKGGKTISEKAELIEFAKDYDPDYYINNQILPSVMKILKELGYEEHDLKFGGKQQSLDSFFD